MAPENRFQKHLKFTREFKPTETTKEDVKSIGQAFVTALEMTFAEYLEEYKKNKVENPNLKALEQTGRDVQSISQLLMQKYGGLFK